MWKDLSSARYKSALQKMAEDNTSREKNMASRAKRMNSKQGNVEMSGMELRYLGRMH